MSFVYMGYQMMSFQSGMLFQQLLERSRNFQSMHFRNIWKGLESCEPCMHMQFLGTYINIIVHLDPNQGKQQRLRNHKYNSFLLSQHLFCIVSHSLSPFCSDPTISGTILLNQPIHKGKEWVNIHRIVLLDGIDTIES